MSNKPETTETIFDGHINRHPMHKAIYELMQEIEMLPASEQQTKVVTMAGALQNGIATMRSEVGRQAKILRDYAEECFPEVNGQKHFARVVMEGVAEELQEEFNP